MHLLIVLPEQPEATGNQVTARRLQSGLAERGHRVDLLPVGLDDSARIESALTAGRPDAVLLLHAFRSGRPWLAAPAAATVPALVLLTGTDVHGGLDDPVQGQVICSVLDRVAAILTQNHLTAAALRQAWPERAARIHHLPPGVRLGTVPYPLRARHGIADDAVLLLHPAGLRPVKANLELLQLCDPLAATLPALRLAFCGPRLDTAYVERIMAALAERPWARYLGVIPPEAMPAALCAADLVLNHSLHEGLANALLEAAALGRPMLVRDIPGNAAVVTHGVNGLRYTDDAGFLSQAATLIDNPALRRQLSRPSEIFMPAAEAETLERHCLSTLREPH